MYDAQGEGLIRFKIFLFFLTQNSVWSYPVITDLAMLMPSWLALELVYVPVGTAFLYADVCGQREEHINKASHLRIFIVLPISLQLHPPLHSVCHFFLKLYF